MIQATSPATISKPTTRSIASPTRTFGLRRPAVAAVDVTARPSFPPSRRASPARDPHSVGKRRSLLDPPSRPHKGGSSARTRLSARPLIRSASVGHSRNLPPCASGGARTHAGGVVNVPDSMGPGQSDRDYPGPTVDSRYGLGLEVGLLVVLHEQY